MQLCIEKRQQAGVTTVTPIQVCPFIQVSKCSTLLHSSTHQDKKLAFWLNAALQQQMTAAWVHHTHTHASLFLYTGLQMLNTVAQQHCSG